MSILDFFFNSNDKDSESRYSAKTDNYGQRKEIDRNEKENSSYNFLQCLPLKVRLCVILFGSFVVILLTVGAYKEVSSIFPSEGIAMRDDSFRYNKNYDKYENYYENYSSKKSSGFLSSMFCGGLKKSSFCED